VEPKPEPKKPEPKVEPKPEPKKPEPKPEPKVVTKKVDANVDPKPAVKGEKSEAKPDKLVAKADPVATKAIPTGAQKSGDENVPSAQPVSAQPVGAGTGNGPGDKGAGGDKGSGGTGKGGGKGTGTGNGGGGTGTGTGNGTGAGKAGGGPTATELGAYHQMIHDRFYGRWEQPIGLERADQNLVVILKIKIRKDGTIAGREIVTPSGNAQLDESVLNSAQKIHQIEPLPSGLSGDTYDVKIAFKLDQG
jgi:TonB family protein